jgi:hypothetical protein
VDFSLVTDLGRPPRLHPPASRFIIEGSIRGGFTMCHEWWFKRQGEEDEASRRMWDEFERTRPLSADEVTEEQPEVTLENPAGPRLTAKE